MDQPLLTVIAEFYAKPGSEEELRGLLKGLVEPSRKEPGCVQYDLHVDNDQGGHFLFYENWASKAHLEEHVRTPHFTAFQAGSAGLLAVAARAVFALRIA
jgi:quinol monooxygenase YgiN